MSMTRCFVRGTKSTTLRNGNVGLGFLWRRWISSSEERSSRGKRFAALWGNGDYGRLGLGSLDSQWRPAFCSSFGGEGLRGIACGGAHTLFLTETGCVYATGLNDFGQLGISDDKSYTTEPVKVSGLPKEIIKIYAGYHHSSAVTVDGELYMWGKNSNGQLGLGKKAAKVVAVPNKVESLTGVTIKMAALGCEHSLAVTDKGEALSWGGGGSGRLGHGHEPSMLGFLRSTSEYTPRLIKKLEGFKVKTVAAGLLHSACIDENGSVFIFGERAVGKLGLGQTKNATTPSMISQLPLSEEVACGGYHTCVVTSDGELYTWGSNENGCLGIGCTDVSHLPERVQGPFLKHAVCQVSCGWKHTAAISGGHVYAWGWGGSHGTFSEDGHSSGGQLGQGSDVDYIEPTWVNLGKNVKALQVSCGFNHTGAILEHT
ncbi:Ultraviolet-B receptor like [Actinidia chinensis var. chinensis]|uniref:Ultraviolet-B receptor like n=1 Tax=Actinidia chinensis var. chinensis TaxID=1590841 RepID=A0A2R6RDF7_ACTCC|nr:Ultraviolet-B receptor like [Actinidia chinensis var. chinensis]